MKLRRSLFITGAFLLFLTAIHLVWIGVAPQAPAHPDASRGVLDLRSLDIPKRGTIDLNGEWSFYPSRLAARAEDLSDRGGGETYIRVPSNWRGEASDDPRSPYGYGTYRLRILVKPEPGRVYAVRISEIYSSSAVYANGRLVGASGTPASNAASYTARNVPYTVFFAADQGKIDLLIQCANFTHAKSGGIFFPIQFGDSGAVSGEAQRQENWQMIVAGIVGLHFVIALLLYIVGDRNRTMLSFAILAMFAALAILSDDAKLLLKAVPLDFEWRSKVIFIAYAGTATFLIDFSRRLVGGRFAFWASRCHGAAAAAYAIFVLLTPSRYHNAYKISATILVSAVVLLIAITALAIVRRHLDSLFLLMASAALMSNIAWAVFKWDAGVYRGFYPFDLIAVFLLFDVYWVMHYFRIMGRLRELTDKLRDEARKKDDFLAQTSHELRTPLHGMLNIAQSVLENERPRMGEQSARNMDMLLSVGKRMSALLNDLLDMARIRERGDLRYQMENVDVQGVTAGVFDILRFMLGAKPVRLINAVPDELPPVLADQARLTQILYNLVHNAIKFTERGHIRVDAVSDGGRIRIRIEDTGTGIEESRLETIFELYEQGSAEARAAGGIGLGLGISRQLAGLMGGTIEVSSRPGHGSTFTLTLDAASPGNAFPAELAPPPSPIDVPMLETAAARESGLPMPAADAVGPADGLEPAALPKARLLPEVPADSRARASGAAAGLFEAGAPSRVLIVDDDPVNLSVLAGILEPEGCEVSAASSAQEALARMEREEWDLLIADVMMPRMSGYELTRVVRQRFSVSELPILLLTARSTPEDIRAGFLAGANDYLAKPADRLELKSRVGALVGLRRSVRDRLRMEAAWLQAQIKPHFLFNTLNSIAALSEVDSERMRTLLAEFGRYLRASFDFRNSDRLVSLEHELGLVRSYLFIEEQRFGERIRIEWDVQADPRTPVPPLSIQPLVENALRHGILRRAQGGTVRIRIAGANREAEIVIADDGVGMDEATRAALLRERDGGKSESSGIALLNTDRRLKQLYGQGLRIDSRPGQGTTVSFRTFDLTERRP